MNIYDMMQETKPKVSISNYSLRIMATSGKGKSPLYSYFAKEIGKRYYNGKTVCALLPLEDRYDHIDGLMVIRPVMKNKMGQIIKDENGKPKLKKTIENWEDLKSIIDMLVDAKLNIPDFPIERVCIDTTTKLEMLAQAEVVALNFKENGKLQDFNECFGSFGRPHAKAIEITNIELNRLRSVGYIIDQTVQTRIKSQVKPITGQEYHINSADSGEGFDGKVFLQNADISFYIVEEMVVGQTGTTKQGKVLNGIHTQGKVLMLDSDGEYKGCKSPFPNTPTSIPADDFEKATKDYFDLFEDRMSKLAGISHDKYTEKSNEEKISTLNLAQLNIDMQKEEKINNEKQDKISKFVEYYDKLLPQMPKESIETCNQYFNALMQQTNTNSILDALMQQDDDTLNMIYNNFGYKA